MNLKFDGRFGDVQFHAGQYQDLFALHLVGESGRFLDLGSKHPEWFNNTIALEKIGWQGLLFDWDSSDHDLHLESNPDSRKSPFFCIDVTKPQLIEILKDHGELHFDYISLDVDDSGYDCLALLVSNGVTFTCLTYEHDSYFRPVDVLKIPAYRLLESRGYLALFEDVNFEFGSPFEDWWIDPAYYDPQILALAHKNIYYKDCLSVLEVNQNAIKRR